MTLEQAVTPSDSLVTFCQAMVSRYATNWPPPEDKLAEGFVSFFPVEQPLGLEAWVQLCNHLSIEVYVCALPRELRGYHCCYENTRSIWLNEEELFVGTKEHSLLHELREILEHIFEDLGRPTVGSQSLETLAEQFAGYVRVVAMLKTLNTLYENLEGIQSRWMQLGCVLLTGIWSLLYLIGCAFFPHFEDQAARQMDQPLPYERNVRLGSGVAVPHPRGIKRV